MEMTPSPTKCRQQQWRASLSQEKKDLLKQDEKERKRVLKRKKNSSINDKEGKKMRQDEFLFLQEETFLEIENQWMADPASVSIHSSLMNSLIVFYLNSGCGRFDKYKNYECGSKPVNETKIIQEINKEMLTIAEQKQMIEDFENGYNSDASLFACGCCGKQEFESECGTSSICYKEV